MKTIYNLQKEANRLRQVTEVDGISPNDTFSLHADTLEYIADMEQNAEGLGILKVYKSVAAMNTDGACPCGTNDKLLRFGQLVVIYDDNNQSQAENGNIYAYQKGEETEPWLLVGKINNIVELFTQITDCKNKIDGLATSVDKFSGKIKTFERELQGGEYNDVLTFDGFTFATALNMSTSSDSCKVKFNMLENVFVAEADGKTYNNWGDAPKYGISNGKGIIPGNNKIFKMGAALYVADNGNLVKLNQVDDTLDENSDNAVQNKTIKAAFDELSGQVSSVESTASGNRTELNNIKEKLKAGDYGSIMPFDGFVTTSELGTYTVSNEYSIKFNTTYNEFVAEVDGKFYVYWNNCESYGEVSRYGIKASKNKLYKIANEFYLWNDSTLVNIYVVDNVLNETSVNPLQNKAIAAAIQSLQESLATKAETTVLNSELDKKANKSDLASKADVSSVNASISDINTKNSAQDTEINNLKSSVSDLSNSLNALSESVMTVKVKGSGAQMKIDNTNTEIESNKTVVKRGFTNVTFTTETTYEMNRRGNIVFVKISNFKPTTMFNMFRKCSGLARINVDGWDTSAVGDMRNVFMECSNLRGLDLSSWDTASVTDMRYMFSYCQAATEIDVRGWNTANVTNMDGVFRACSQLTEVDVSSWEISKVQSMEYMFAECPKLQRLDLSSWDLSSLNNIRNIFTGSGELSELKLGEGFGKMPDWLGSVDFTPLTKWTGASVQTLRNLYNRSQNGKRSITLRLSSQTKAALGSDGISAITSKGYTIA